MHFGNMKPRPSNGKATRRNNDLEHVARDRGVDPARYRALRRMSPAAVGRALEFTDADRTRLRAWTIRAVDAVETPQERKRRNDRERQARRRGAVSIPASHATGRLMILLRELLGDGRSVPVPEILRRAIQAGLETKGASTPGKALRLAKAELGVESRKIGFNRGWCWTLPQSAKPEQRQQHAVATSAKAPLRVTSVSGTGRKSLKSSKAPLRVAPIRSSPVHDGRHHTRPEQQGALRNGVRSKIAARPSAIQLSNEKKIANPIEAPLREWLEFVEKGPADERLSWSLNAGDGVFDDVEGFAFGGHDDDSRDRDHGAGWQRRHSGAQTWGAAS